MQIEHNTYTFEGHFLRWFVVSMPLNETNFLLHWITDEQMLWCFDNCKSGYCKCSNRMIAFEDRREAMMFKMLFL